MADDEVEIPQRPAIVTTTELQVGDKVRWLEELAESEVYVREQRHDPLDTEREREEPGHVYEVAEVHADGWVALAEPGPDGDLEITVPSVAPSYLQTV